MRKIALVEKINKNPMSATLGDQPAPAADAGAELLLFLSFAMFAGAFASGYLPMLITLAPAR